MINNNIIDSNEVHRIVFENNTVLIERTDGTATSVTWKEFQTMEVI